jgi:large conductance mechanosensitive channel
MPSVGMLVGGVDFSSLAVTLAPANGETPAVVLSYGKLVQSIIDFLVVAFAIFMGVKAINRFKREEEAAPSVPTKDQELLAEIRDLLAARQAR